MANRIPRNPRTDTQQKRAFQRLKGGGFGDGVTIVADSKGAYAVQCAAPVKATADGVGLALADNGALSVSAGKLGVNVDNATVEAADNALRIKDGGIGSDKIAAAAVSFSKVKIADQSALEDDGNGGLRVQVDGSSIRRDAAGVGINWSSKMLVRAANPGGTTVLGPRIESSNPAAPANGEFWYNTAGGRFELCSAGLISGLVTVVRPITADSPAVANTTVNTSFGQYVTLPANWLAAGKGFRLTAAGKYSCSGTPTLQIAAYLDGPAGRGLDGGQITILNNAANLRWKLDLLVVCRAEGVNGSIQLTGSLISEGGQQVGVLGQEPITVDTTLPHTIEIAAKWGVASAANTTVLRTFMVELLH